jgi:hypothetical protein
VHSRRIIAPIGDLPLPEASEMKARRKRRMPSDARRQPKSTQKMNF